MKLLNILVEIGHPAHVHFFKNPIYIWKKEGHRVFVVTRDKEITHRLLDEIGIPYKPLTKQQTNFILMMIELIIRWIKIFFIIKAKKIDIAISISGISTSFPAWLAGIPNITDTDTEDAALSNAIAFKFSNIVLTPSTFLNKENFKKIKAYDSFHELAYLHPNWFKPSEDNLNTFQIQSDKYIVIRLVKWKALHDINENGISEENLSGLIDHLKMKGYSAMISSERKISERFSPFMIRGQLSKIFDLMAFSSGYIGESPTMAVETAILGKPSVLINSRVNHLGNMIELQKKYKILFNFMNYEEAFPFIDNEFFSGELASTINAGLKKFYEEKIDISSWIAQYTIDYALKYKKG